jgi:hypothetical protein
MENMSTTESRPAGLHRSSGEQAPADPILFASREQSGTPNRRQADQSKLVSKQETESECTRDAFRAVESSSEHSGHRDTRMPRLEEAAARYRILPQTISKLAYEQIFPNPDAGVDSWRASTLDLIVETILRDGLPPNLSLP